MLYKLLQPLLFKFSPECLHDAAILALSHNLVPAQKIPTYPRLQCKFFDIEFAHPLGLAAGFDKNAQAVTGLCQQGFSFLELGTVTPKAQFGNPKPRIFRLEAEKSLINALGFNNKGVEFFLQQIEKNPPKMPFGINIGQNKNSDENDFPLMMDKIHNKSTYITINISSPNTPGLRNLQKQGKVENFLQLIKDKKEDLQMKMPIFIKISPDMEKQDLQNLVENVLKMDCFAGLIVSNTTIDHNEKHSGGLSGKKLLEKSTQALKSVNEITQGKLILIGVGGIFSADDVIAKMQAGAHLVQIYSSFIYEGFAIIPKILQDLNKNLEKIGIHNIQDIVGKEKI